MIKNPPTNAGGAGSILGSGRSPGEGNGNPLQYSCLGNLMDREEPERATVHGVTKESDRTKHSIAHSFVKKNFSLSHICLLSIWTQRIDSCVTEWIIIQDCICFILKLFLFGQRVRQPPLVPLYILGFPIRTHPPCTVLPVACLLDWKL